MKTATWEDEYKVGMAQYRTREYAAAVKSFDRAITLGTNELAVHNMAATAMSRLGDGFTRSAIEKVESNCTRFKRHTRVWKAWHLKADILLRARDYRGANKALDDALPFTRRLAGPKAKEAKDTIEALRRKVRLAFQRDAETRRDAAQKQQTDIVEAQRRAKIAKTNYMGYLPRDVLVQIAEMVIKDQPDANIIMALVCREWRHAIMDQPRLWRRLILDTRRPIDKARLYRDLSRKRIHKVEYTDRFDWRHSHGVAEILKDSADNITCLVGRPDQFGPGLQGQFTALQRLTLNGPSGHHSHLDLGILHPDSDALQELDGSAMTVTLVEDVNDPRHQLAQQLGLVQSLTLSACAIVAHVPDNRFDENPRAALLQHLKNVRAINLDQMAWNLALRNVTAGIPQNNGPAGNANRIVMSDLETYEEASANFMSHLPLFDLVVAPNLTRLLLWNLHGGWQSRAVDQLNATGLASALPTLIALDIGKSAVDQFELLRVLRRMKSLRFLNVSFCGMDDAFLDAIQLKTDVFDSEQVLPHLTALSIAGHESISTVAVRDFLNSRLPEAERIPIRVERAPVKGPSMFKPTAPKVDKGKGRAVPQGTQHGSQAPRASGGSIPGSTQPPSIPPSDSFPVTQPVVNLPVNPRIDWLNIDHCEKVEPSAVARWMTKVRFLSHEPGTPDYERIRGKGRWSWDVEWTEDCPRGEKATGCHLRKVPGRVDAWEIRHTCQARAEARIAAVEAKEGLEKKTPGWFKMPKLQSTASTLDDA